MQRGIIEPIFVGTHLVQGIPPFWSDQGGTIITTRASLVSRLLQIILPWWSPWFHRIFLNGTLRTTGNCYIYTEEEDDKSNPSLTSPIIQSPAWFHRSITGPQAISCSTHALTRTSTTHSLTSSLFDVQQSIRASLNGTLWTSVDTFTLSSHRWPCIISP